MDMMFMEQHFLRSPLRLYSDMDVENNNTGSLFSVAMMEKARAQLQLWGRTSGPGYPPGSGEVLIPYHGHRAPVGIWHPGLLLPPPQQLTPPPPSTSTASTPSPSPQEKLPRPAAVFPQHHRFSPYQMVPKREPVPTRN